MDNNQEITITHKYSFKNYLRFTYIAAYSRPLMLFLIIISIVSILFFLTNESSDKFFFYYSFFFLLGLPVLIYYSARKRFYSNKILSETFIYTINQQGIYSKGESSESTYTWDKLYKASEFYNWFLFYTTNVNAIILPMSSFKNNEEVGLIRSYIKTAFPGALELNKLKRQLFLANAIILALSFFAFLYRYNLDRIAIIYAMVFSQLIVAVTVSGILSAIFALIPSKILSYRQRALKIFLWGLCIINVVIAIILLVFDCFGFFGTVNQI